MLFRIDPRILAFCLIFGCDPAEVGPPDGGTMDAGDPHMGLRLPRCEDTDPAPATPLPHVPSTLVGTLVPRVFPEGLAGRVSPALERGEMMYRGLDYHLASPGPGQPHLERTDLGARLDPSTERRSLAFFAHLSDFQLADDEAPTRLSRFDNPVVRGGLRAQEAYLPRAVSAMNRTLTRIAPEDGFDFGIITGDCGDSALRNELEWVIALMNGAEGLHTDSGDDDDPVPGPGNDPKDPFDPTPFPARWLYVPGNHDVEVVGISLPNEISNATALGNNASGGTRDYRRWYAEVVTGEVPADSNRVLLERDDIVEILRAETSIGPAGPPGHGYPETGPVDTTLGANWAYDAIPGLLRILALDTSDMTGGSPGMVRQPTIDGWLIPELDRAVSDGVLVILSSHHSTRSINRIRSELGDTVVEDALTGEELEAFVSSRPEVIAWLVGHSHDNRVRAIADPTGTHPGYWEIMTSAMVDYPGQARTIELVDNGDGTISLFGTLIDFDTDDCFERRFRALMQIEYASGWADDVSLEAHDMNVELVRAIPPSARTAVESARARTRIDSLTTLAGR
jgi:hypothetical protein